MKKNEILQAAVAFVILVFAINFLVPFITGSAQALIVLSGSMTPLMLPGDMILVKEITPQELNSGDVIAFRDPGGEPNTLITHRIVSIEEEEERIFKTKGDANEEEDDFFVPASNVVGKLTFVIPFAGYLPEATKEKNLFFLTIILPAALIILDEIKTIISYSNPARARKIEHEKKKNSRRTFYKIKGKRLATILLIGGFVFTGLTLNSSEENGSLVLGEENTVKNSGFLPEVYVLTTEDMQQRLLIEPWYAVVPPKNAAQVTAPENTPVKISSVPYILPVFWIVSLAEVNPYLPFIAEVLMCTSVITLLLFPLWCRKVTRGEHKKRASFQRSIRKWRRTLRLA